MSWAALEAGAPRMASHARSLIARTRFVYLGTVRRDGGVRISPVEAHIVGGELMLVMIASSQKARDVARDPRVTLQSPVRDPGDPGVELKVRGRVVEVEAVQREATADVVEAASGWRPQPSWRFLGVDVDAVAVLAWEHGEMMLSRWDRRRGLRPAARLRLDVQASRYEPVD